MVIINTTKEMISNYIKNGLTALCIATAAVSITTNAQAQKIEFEEPVKLPEMINSGDAEEVYPLLSLDGNSLFFVRAFHDQNVGGKNTGHDIWMVTKDANNQWNASTNDFPQLNTRFSNAVVGVTHGGSKMYLLNSYRNKEKSEAGLAYTTRTGSNWSKPVDVAIPGLLPNTRLYGFYITPDEKQMFITMEDSNSVGKEDLYVSLNENGRWSAPKNLGSSINTTGFEMSPFLAGDGKTLFFSSNRDGGNGDADIYMTTRQDDSWTNWSAPQHLGDVLNTSSFDAYFMMTKDSTVYFASNKDGDLSDIYRTKMSIRDTTPPVAAVKKQPMFVFFEFDKYSLTPAAKAYLDNVADSVQSGRMEKVALEGHADHIGTDEYNIQLSQKRANSARAYLVSKGVSNDLITINYFGESKPMAANINPDGSDNPEGRALNRRVEIKLTPEEPAFTEEIMP